MATAVLNWTETDPDNGSVVRRSMSMRNEGSARRILVVLAELDHVSDATMEVYDPNVIPYPGA